MTEEEKVAVIKALWDWGRAFQQEEKNVIYLEEKMYAVKLKRLDFVAIVKANDMFEAVRKVRQDIIHY